MPTLPHQPPAAEALLADGTTAAIRPIEARDHAAVLDLHAVRMSEESRRLRFFGASRRAPLIAAERLCAPRRPGCRLRQRAVTRWKMSSGARP